MSVSVSIEEVLKSEYVILKKTDLLSLLAEVSVNQKKDARKKWLTVKEVRQRYGKTRYWLNQAEKDPFSKLKVNPGAGKTSTKTYHSQSIEDELERQCV